MLTFNGVVILGFLVILLGFIYIRAIISDMEKDTLNLMKLSVNLTLLLRECRHELGFDDMLKHSEEFKNTSEEVQVTEVFLHNPDKKLH